MAEQQDNPQATPPAPAEPASPADAAAASLPSGPPSKPGRWQIPLLIFSVVACACAGWFLYLHIPRESWQSRFEHAEALMEQAADGNFRPADQAAEELLRDTPTWDDDKTRKLYLLLAEIRFRSIRYSGDQSPQQLGELINFYENAFRAGRRRRLISPSDSATPTPPWATSTRPSRNTRTPTGWTSAALAG